MTAKEQGLPELPESVAWQFCETGWAGTTAWRDAPDKDTAAKWVAKVNAMDGYTAHVRALYTADQMRAYALAALASDTGGRGVVGDMGFGKLAECPPELEEPPMTAEEKAALVKKFTAKILDAESALRAQPAGGGEEVEADLCCDSCGTVVCCPKCDITPPESGGQGEAVRKVIAEMNEFLEQDAEVWLDTLARWRDELTQGGGNGR